MISGIALGFVMGIISGITANILLKALVETSNVKVSTITALLGELGSIPILMLGGRTIGLIPKDIKFNFEAYLLTLMLVFGAIIIWPLFRWIINLGEELGKNSG